MKFKKLVIALGLTSALPMVHANDAEQTEILTYNYTYDTHGQVKTVDGPRKDVEDITTYDYEQGNLTKVTNALGHTAESKDFHDYYGLPQTLIDANGIVTKLAYDEQGRLKTSTLKSSAGDLTTTYVYDDATGLVTKITRPDGTETNYEYDAFFRLKATYNGLNERIEYELDDMGNITKQTIKYMNGTIAKQHRQVFDKLGRIIESVSANGKKTTFTYDPNSNRLSIINPLKRTSGQAFDALNRLKKSTDALNNITELEYNEFDQIRFVKHPRGVTTEYQYDDFNRLVKRVSPDSGVTTYRYDEANNIIESTDATGKVTSYKYDALNRIKEKKFNADETFDYTITYVYDETENGNVGIGRLTGVKDAHGMYAYQYDDRGNLVTQIRSTTYARTTLEHVTRYHYNATNQLEGITYPSGIRVNYSWSVLGKVDGITALLPGETKEKTIIKDASYMPYGGVTTFKWGNGILLSRSYDQDYRITGHLATGIDRRHFSYDDNSNITGIDRGVNSQTFAYDALDRLEGETGSYGSKTYVYDELGNRLSRSWKLGDKTETQTLTYKNNSNQLDKIENKAVVHTESGHFKKYDGDVYQYDPTGRLERVVNGGRLKVYNYYDSFGRRIRRVDGSLYQDFYTYSNGGNLLSELSYFERDLKQTSEYIWLGSMPIAHIAGKDGKYTISFIHTDHLNTPRYATNDQKKVVWQWESDAFGVGDAEEDVDGDGIKTAISLRFPGQVYDKETGTYYNVNRDYNPRLGRYVQTDPIGLNGGMNTYAYALQNPNRYTDPEGLLAPQAAGFIIGSISGGVGGFMAGMASGQSGWDLVGSVAGGAVAGGFVGAVTLNAAAAGSAGGALVSGSIARTAITTSVSGMASNVLGQYAGINISRVGKGMSLLTPQAAFRCKEFSGAQVLLSGIPGPFAAMNPLGIASRYQTGGIVRSNAASIAATGTQLGILGGLRNSTQLLTELVAEGPANGIDEQSCLCVPTEKAKE